MKPSELEALIRATLDDETVDIKDMTDNGGYGLVRYDHTVTVVGGPDPRTETRHIVHRWATTLTDGSPVGTESGLLLYGGGYYDEEEDARQDYRRRKDGPPETKRAGLSPAQAAAKAAIDGR